MFEHVHFVKILMLKSASYVKRLKEECQLASYSQKLVTVQTELQKKYNSIFNKLLEVKNSIRDSSCLRCFGTALTTGVSEQLGVLKSAEFAWGFGV